jgi:mevalonate kinase
MVKYFSTKYPLLQQDYLVNLNSHIPILIQALEKNNLSQFKEVINLYGKFLESIPICTPQVAIANNLIREQNGAAKVCGAGGLTNGSGIVLSINL